MRKEACNNCGKEARVITGNYRFDEVGLPVLLENIDMIDCKECGTTEPIIPDMNGLMHVIAFAVIAHPCKLNGGEVRFLRKYLGMNGEEFARLVDIDRTTLSKWENNQQDVGKHSDRLIRFLVVSKSEDLRKQIEQFMEKYGQLTDCDPPRRPQLRVNTTTLEYEYA
jgi:DNA-binding transcriptional regulator YiaG